MDEEKHKLNEDLVEKLENLALMYEQPAVFLDEYFASIRSSIDINFEHLLQLIRTQHEKDVLSGNDNLCEMDIYDVFLERIEKFRSGFVSALGQLEQIEIPVGADDSKQMLSDLTERVNAFIASENFRGLGEMEDAYVQLALDIIAATTKQERRLLDKRCAVYLPGERAIGRLVRIDENCLTRDELSCLKFYEASDSSWPQLVHEELQRLLNNKLAVEVSHLFVIDENTLNLLFYLKEVKSNYESSENGIVSLSSHSTIDQQQNKNFEPTTLGEFLAGLNNALSVLFKKSTSNFWKELAKNTIDGVVFSEMPGFVSDIEEIEWNFSGNRLKEFTVADSLVSKIKSIDLSDNQFLTLNEELLAKCAHLEKLNLKKSCLPGTNFSLNFLDQLTELVDLELTLPETTSVNFDVFANMNQLKNLNINGASSLDSNLAPLELTSDVITKLTAAPKLEKLGLSYFKIKTVDIQALEGLVPLEKIELDNNQIEFINDGAFVKMLNERTRKSTQQNVSLCNNRIRTLRKETLKGLDEVVYITLINNEIEELQAGLFEDTQLQGVDLSHNRIREVKRGVFDRIGSISFLDLSANPIESIEPRSFGTFNKLAILDLSNCKLKCINNRMFCKLNNLKCLLLTNNQIESFEVITNDGTLRIDGILTQEEDYKIVSANLFRGLDELETLSLMNNKLKKIDLNLFSSLPSLKILDLSNNLITEMNEVMNENLSELKILDLGGNQLTEINKQAFSGSEKLEKLVLKNNKLKRLDDDFFQPFRKLETLHLQNNNLSIDIKKETFSKCQQIEEINLLDNKSVQIKAGAFRGLKKLHTLKTDLTLVIIPRGIEFIPKIVKSLEYELRTRKLENTEGSDTQDDESADLKEVAKIEEPTADSNKDGDETVSSPSDSDGEPIDDTNDDAQEGDEKSIYANDREESPENETTTRDLKQIEVSNILDQSADSNDVEDAKSDVSFSNSSDQLEKRMQDFFDAKYLADLLSDDKEKASDIAEIKERTADADDDGQNDNDSSSDSDDADINNNHSSSDSDDEEENSENNKERTLFIGNSDYATLEMFFFDYKNRSWCVNIRNFGLINCALKSLDRIELNARSTQLDVSKNLLETLDPDWIKGLAKLSDLNVAGNLIESLSDPDLFQNHPELFKINLSGNKLNHIHRDLFKHLTKLKSLDISNNPALTTIDCRMFRGLFSLKQLNLSGNNISAFDFSSLFRSCRLLECLNLSNNQLDNESVNEASMNGSTAQNLKELMLANNRLERIDFVRNLYRLEKLDLSGNKIDSVCSNGVNIFGRLVKLQHLDLSGNQIKALEESVLFYLSQQNIMVVLTNNPISDLNQLKILKRLNY